MTCKFLYERGEIVGKLILVAVVIGCLFFIYTEMRKSERVSSFRVTERSSVHGKIQYCINDSCWWDDYDWDKIKKFK